MRATENDLHLEYWKTKAIEQRARCRAGLRLFTHGRDLRTARLIRLMVAAGWKASRIYCDIQPPFDRKAWHWTT